MIEQGIITVAQNSDVDYIRLAYLQCESLRRTNPRLPYAVVTDFQSSRDIGTCARAQFDHVIVLHEDLAQEQTWKQRNECQLFAMTPFRETIKVECDLLFTTDISSWWRLLRNRDVVISSGCVDHRGQTGTSRRYRQAFDDNALPDIYTGLMYWRKSVTAQRLFSLARSIYLNWDDLKTQLAKTDDPGSTDMVFALAAKILGPELVTLPTDVFRMAHLKPSMCGLLETQPWHTQLMWDLDADGMRIAGWQQNYPVHYHDKDFAEELPDD